MKGDRGNGIRVPSPDVVTYISHVRQRGMFWYRTTNCYAQRHGPQACSCIRESPSADPVVWYKLELHVL
jgi:hypothetical protein